MSGAIEIRRSTGGALNAVEHCVHSSKPRRPASLMSRMPRVSESAAVCHLVSKRIGGASPRSVIS